MIAIADWLHHRLDEQRFERIVLVMLVAAGFALLVGLEPPRGSLRSDGSSGRAGELLFRARHAGRTALRPGSGLEQLVIDAARSLSGALFGGLALAEHRQILLFVHVFAFVGWAGPAMGGSWFVYAASWDRAKQPDDQERLRREQWVRRQFNLVVAAEHVAFATLVVTGLMLAEAVDWAWAEQSWLGWKLVMVFLLFVPMELIDVALSAWFGRAMKVDEDGHALDAAQYARASRWQDLFLRATIPPVMIGIPVALYLAVVKPL